MTSAAERIHRELTSWPGVEAEPHRSGGRGYRVAGLEIGHVHGDDLVEISFPKPVRDEVVAARLAERHPLLPESGWVSKPLDHDPDVEIALALLRRAYGLAGGRSRGSAAADEGELDEVGEASRQSFPASDPPS
ncbi:MAG TPA: luciferase family protein [Thermoanaerobaculia bacterium]|nr:luciferase family protein [Thermoanaerobaculia bacterium]